MTASPFTSPVRAVGTAAALAAASALLSACGGSGGSADGADHGQHGTSRHNAADVAFASRMIPHHRQAVEMAGLAHKQAGSGQVRTLAIRIEKAQGPEIRRMSGWLEEWGEPVPGSASASPSSGHAGHGSGRMGHGSGHHGGHMPGMAGMMSEREMKELKAAHGRKFDRKFLTMMVGHHEGAVDMARTERSRGRYAPAKKLASSVISSQSAEIRDMRKMSKQLGG